MAFLEIHPSGEKPLRRELVAARITLGRSSGCDISLADPAVSRVHVEICQQGERYVVHDLGSRNHTYVNRELLSGPRPLSHLDQIRLGSTHAIFFAEHDIHSPEDDDASDTASVSHPGAEPSSLPGLPRSRQLPEQLIEVARRLFDVGNMYRELEFAHKIQKALLPRPAPRLPGYRLWADTHPCFAVGGDFFDYLALPGGLLGIVVGDVSGHGVGAALLAHYVQASIRTALRYESNLESLVRRLNDDVFHHTKSNQFVTAFICVLDPVTGNFSYMNAAHCPPLTTWSDGRACFLEGSNIMIGAYPEQQFEVRRARLQAGSSIVAYSDGLSECRDSEGAAFGQRRLLDFFAPRAVSDPGVIARDLEAALEEFVGPDTRMKDDQTLLLLQRLK